MSTPTSSAADREQSIARVPYEARATTSARVHIDEVATEDAVEKLLALLRQGEEGALPTSTFGRLRRTATMAARTAGSALKSKLSGESTLDDDAVARLVVSLGELKGVSMKVGQILSYIDAPIPSNVRRQLAVLQAQSQRMPFADVERTIRSELGPRADDLLETLEREPVSSASIGQVHRARLPGGAGDVGVAVKVLHTGIEEALRADFRGAQVGKRIARVLVPGADISDLIDEAEHALLDECDYEREAHNQERFAHVYAGRRADDAIIVPDVHRDWSARRVLTTTWHDGMPLETFLASATQAARDRAGAAMFRFYVATFYAHGFFNNDPHPGNFLFHEDGRVVFLDYGGVRDFSRHIVRAMAQLSVAVREGGDDDVEAGLLALGARFEGRRASRERAAGVELARAFFAPLVAPGRRAIEVGFMSTMQELVQHKRALLRLHLPGELLFLVRIRFGAYSVLSRLGSKLDWRALEAAAAAAALAPSSQR
jgi:predicted unusual protein kinase regulating ubiquinone biosynthesis (AarF/ABC1/UbiB family)